MTPIRVAFLAAALGRGAFGLSREMQATLDEHNVYRCMHGLPLYTWDNAIARNAQAHADKGEFRHSTAAERTHNGEYWGENLAWGYPSWTGARATGRWYAEIRFTDPRGLAEGPRDSHGGPIGHYTQVVWKDSVRLGCGKGTRNDRGGDYWVCQYGPGGNWRGRYRENVFAPTRSESSCRSRSAMTITDEDEDLTIAVDAGEESSTEDDGDDDDDSSTEVDGDDDDDSSTEDDDDDDDDSSTEDDGDDDDDESSTTVSEDGSGGEGSEGSKDSGAFSMQTLMTLFALPLAVISNFAA